MRVGEWLPEIAHLNIFYACTKNVNEPATKSPFSCIEVKTLAATCFLAVVNTGFKTNS
jgi:hypothetical protein